MKRLLKYWHENKQKILITIGVIVFLIICIRIADEMVRKQNENRTPTIQNNFTAEDVTNPENAVITDTELTEEERKEYSQIIANFVNLCNQKEIDEAYNLLSESCKEELYYDVNTFHNNYINNIFTTPKEYQLELWSEFSDNVTYQITYYEGNLLQTGGQSSNRNFVDYITIVKQNQEIKLNIGKLVDKQTVSSVAENRDIKVTINSRAIFMDYEIYDLTVENASNNTILINDGTIANNIVLLDEKNDEYDSIIYELPMSSLTLNSGEQKSFRLKFNKVYNASSQIRFMEIRNIYLDKEQYDAKQNQEEVEKTTIRIKL